MSSKSTELTLAKATAKVADALGIETTNTEEALSAHQTEVALEVETRRYEREVFDLGAEFNRRRERMRQHHLNSIAAISSLQEAAE